MTAWQDALKWEIDWWGNCVNTLGEELKQIVYAKRMGLEFFHDGKSPYNIDLGGRSVLDVGGGPMSLLLRCRNISHARVVDPMGMPAWVVERYRAAGIELATCPAEEMEEAGWDEVWVYNVLQHTRNLDIAITRIREAGRLLRIFEWVGTAINVGHPHALSAELLDRSLGGQGKTEVLNGEAHCFGTCYYGIFPLP